MRNKICYNTMDTRYCSKKKPYFFFWYVFHILNNIRYSIEIDQKMQRVSGFLAIYSRLKNKRILVTKTKKNDRGKPIRHYSTSSVENFFRVKWIRFSPLVTRYSNWNMSNLLRTTAKEKHGKSTRDSNSSTLYLENFVEESIIS